jgi:hypothetical protein
MRGNTQKSDNRINEAPSPSSPGAWTSARLESASSTQAMFSTFAAALIASAAAATYFAR